MNAERHGDPAAPPGKPEHELLYDWNRADGQVTRRDFTPRLVDETLRDGLQASSVRDPRIADKLELVHLMAELGIDCVALGFPAASARQNSDVRALAQEIASQKLAIRGCAVSRALVADLRPILEISEAVGLPLEVGMFVGSSPIRHYVEAWPIDQLLTRSEEAVRFAVRHGLEVMYVTEDGTRSHPDTLRRLCRVAVDHGARRICIADTVGQSTPYGARAIVRYVRGLLDTWDPRVQIDWHGHSDRGLALASSLAAWQAGAERCHGTVLGIGERSGNTPIEQLLVNLCLDGYRDGELRLVPTYVERAASALGATVPDRQPIVGGDAFRTATGTHAAALRKAEALGDSWLADRVFSSVPSRLVGREQRIGIGPLSGESNALIVLDRRGIPREPALMAALLDAAKCRDRLLDEHEIDSIIHTYRRPAPAT